MMTGKANAQTAGFVESYNTVADGGNTPQVNMYVYGTIRDQLGWSAWTLTSETYSEAYAGFTYAPAKWIEVSASLGLESAEKSFRQGASVWLGKGRWSLLSIHEDGGSGYWYRYLGTYQVSKTLAVGVNSTRFLGTGPYAEKKFGKVAPFGELMPSVRAEASRGSDSISESIDPAFKGRLAPLLF